MASIRKRGIKWQAQVRVFGHPPMTKSFSKRDLAVTWARQKEAEIERGEIPTSPRLLQSVTLGDLLDRYQQDAVTAIEAAIEAGQKDVLVAMATGTGKTRTCNRAHVPTAEAQALSAHPLPGRPERPRRADHAGSADALRDSRLWSWPTPTAGIVSHRTRRRPLRSNQGDCRPARRGRGTGQHCSGAMIEPEAAR